MLFSLLTLLIASTADAACTSPAGVAGNLRFIAPDLQFCDGTSWQTTAVTTTATSCTTAGAVTYASNILSYCNGSVLVRTDGATNGTCAAGLAGKVQYDTTNSQPQYCNGTNWIVMRAPAAPLPPSSSIFSYTGANQTFTVPAGVTSITVKLWGGGGGRGRTGCSFPNSGGGAGATVGTLAVTPGQSITVLVAGGGKVGNANPNAGGFGGGGAGSTESGGGGGRSAIISSSVEYMTAGGGGGGGCNNTTADQYGGAGGGAAGSAGSGANSGGGGTASAGGAGASGATAGSQFTGGAGNSGYGAGGGGGYYGGGGASATSNMVGAGGGGSGFAHASVTSKTLTPGSGAVQALSGDSANAGAGAGGTGTGSTADGANGRVVIYY